MGPKIIEPALKELKLKVLLAEYERVIKEVITHKSTQQTILNFIIGLAAAEIGLLAKFMEKGFDARYMVMMLVVPVPFGLLALYHSAYTMRIHNLAGYMDGGLRKKIEMLAGSGVLEAPSYHATRNVFALHRATKDGQFTFLALMGLKVVPQLIPIAACVSIGIYAMSWWQQIWLGLNILFMVYTATIQHD